MGRGSKFPVGSSRLFGDRARAGKSGVQKAQKNFGDN